MIKIKKNDLLKDPVKHINIKSINYTEIIGALKNMSFTTRIIWNLERTNTDD
jgi:hypothetical protein